MKKPTLLLVVVSRIDRGVLLANQIRFSEIEAEFKKALSAASGKASGLAEPFVRMKTADFWSIEAPADVEVKPVKKVLYRDDVWAKFDEGVYALLASDAASRGRVLEQLFTVWIPAERQDAVKAVLS